MAFAKTAPVDMKVFTKNKTFWLFPILVVVVVVLSFILVLLPQLEGLLSIRAEIKSESERLDRLAEKRSQLEQLNEPALLQQYALLSQALPAEKPVPQILVALTGMSQAVNLTLLNYDFSPGDLATAAAQTEDEPEEELAIVPVEYSVKGDTESMLAFLKLIESAMPVLSLKSVDLSGFFGDNPPRNVSEPEAEMVMNAYFAHTPKTLGKVSDPLPVLTADEAAVLEALQTYQSYATAIDTSSLLDQSVKENLFDFD